MQARTPNAALRRLGGFFAVDDDWERPGPLDTDDVVTGVATLAFGGLALELYRSGGALETTTAPIWAQWLAVITGAVLLIGRRRWPLSVGVLAAGHMFVIGLTMPAIMTQITMQLVYFIAYFSAVAWGRHRRETMLAVGGLVAFMFVWLAWQFALGSGVDDIRSSLAEDADRQLRVGRAGHGRRAAHRAGQRAVLRRRGAGRAAVLAQGPGSRPGSPSRPSARRAGRASCVVGPWSRNGCGSPASCTTSWPTTCR